MQKSRLADGISATEVCEFARTAENPYHAMLLHQVQYGCSLAGVILQWICSLLTDRTQQLTYNGSLSAVWSVMFGMPQGSVLGLLLYVLYMAELSNVIMRH